MEEKDLELENEEPEGEESKEPNGKKVYKIPEWLKAMPADRRRTILNLHVWASRERFLKRERQSAKNFIASLKNQLTKEGYEFSKIYELEDQIKVIEKMIEKIEKEMEAELITLSIYNRFLKNIKGVGIWIAAAIISQIGDIARFHSISALRKYSGWYPENGHAVKKISDEKCSYSPKMHQTFYQFMDGVMRAKDEVYYQDYLRYHEAIYRKHPEYLDRKATKGQKIEGIPIHVLRQAKRKVIQKFQADLFCIWRDLEDLPPTKPYAIGILGHEGFIDPLKENKHYEPRPT